MSRKKGRIETEGAGALGHNPFAGPLDGLQALEGKGQGAKPRGRTRPKLTPKKPPPRVELRRETKGRGGKAVIVISGLPPSLNQPGRKALLKRLQSACATGGSVKDDCLEIQGDHRDRLEELLRAEGYRPVRTGG